MRPQKRAHFGVDHFYLLAQVVAPTADHIGTEAAAAGDLQIDVIVNN